MINIRNAGIIAEFQLFKPPTVEEWKNQEVLKIKGNLFYFILKRTNKGV